MKETRQNMMNYGVIMNVTDKTAPFKVPFLFINYKNYPELVSEFYV